MVHRGTQHLLSVPCLGPQLLSQLHMGQGRRTALSAFIWQRGGETQQPSFQTQACFLWQSLELDSVAFALFFCV